MNEAISKQIVNLWERSETFLEQAANDIYRIEFMRDALKFSLESSKPLVYEIVQGKTGDSRDVAVTVTHDAGEVGEWEETEVVLSILNYYTFPVTAILDSIRLSQDGTLNEALDVRPLMFSGPAPTMIIWSGSNKDTIQESGYPELTTEDAVKAFNHWLSYIFGVSVSASDEVNAN